MCWVRCVGAGDGFGGGWMKGGRDSKYFCAIGQLDLYRKSQLIFKFHRSIEEKVNFWRFEGWSHFGSPDYFEG